MYQLFKHTIYSHSILIISKISEIFIGRVGKNIGWVFLLYEMINYESQIYFGIQSFVYSLIPINEIHIKKFSSIRKVNEYTNGHDYFPAYY